MTANLLRSQLPHSQELLKQKRTELRFRTSLNSSEVQICVKQLAHLQSECKCTHWFPDGDSLLIISCMVTTAISYTFFFPFLVSETYSTVRAMTSPMSTLYFFSIAFQSVSACDKLGNANYACSKADWSRRADRRCFLSSFIFLFLQLPQPETTDYLSTELLSLLVVLFLCDGFVHKSFEEIAARQIVTLKLKVIL